MNLVRHIEVLGVVGTAAELGAHTKVADKESMVALAVPQVVELQLAVWVVFQPAAEGPAWRQGLGCLQEQESRIEVLLDRLLEIETQAYHCLSALL
jgi:hypothetical protein